MDMGLDPAPFVTLRLTDTEATRELWPHKFEVLYKVRVYAGRRKCAGVQIGQGPSTQSRKGHQHCWAEAMDGAICRGHQTSIAARSACTGTQGGEARIVKGANKVQGQEEVTNTVQML